MSAKRTSSPGRVLAYLDPNARNRTLLELVRRFAQRDGCEVLALSVIRELPWHIRVDRRHSKQIRHALESAASEALAEDAAFLEDAGVRVRTKVRWGRPFEAIIQEALRRPTQLVLKTAHPDSRDDARLFGATAMHLFRKCPVPVWTVKPRRSSRVRRVLAAVDPGKPAPDGVDLNTKILDWAKRVALDEKAELHVCHAFWIEGEHLFRSRMPKADYRRHLQESAARVTAAMEPILDQLGLSLDDPNVHVLKGDPGKVIPALVEEQKVDLLVMGTIARSGTPGVFIGNTAERMLRSVDCSVLALKPDDFVSPIPPSD